MTRRLRDDCFLHDQAEGGRIAHDEAVQRLAATVPSLTERERVDLWAANGRVLAAPVVARQPVPAHTNAAVDGYAFAAASYDRASGTSFPVVGRAAAGHALTDAIPPGQAARILTGAAMPVGTDTVAMQEDCDAARRDGHAWVSVPAGLKPYANVRKAGEDLASGSVVLDAGHVLRPQDLAAIASVGLGAIACVRRPRVAIVSTGDEIVRPTAGASGDTASVASLAHGHVFDANGPMLAALVATCGADVTDLGVWPDQRDAVSERLAAAATRYDVILTSGGASRGEEDHIATSLAGLGSRHFWQINIKPGRPMMFGQIGDCVLAGLPGNPVAVFVCFLLYVAPLIRQIGGAPWREPHRFKVPATFAFTGRKTGRREFWRGLLVEHDGQLGVDKFARDGSGLISGLRAADGLIDIPEQHGDVSPGDLVDFVPFSQFGIPPR